MRILTSLILVLSLLVSVVTFGQQNKALTHFVFDKISVNPGATGVGMRDGICGTTIFRNQWSRPEGAPNSGLLNVEGNFSRFFNGGVGMSFYHDQIGFARQNNLVLNYSYHLVLGDGLLGIGAGVGLVNYGMEPEWVTPDNNPEDNSLPQAVTETNLDANFGLYYLHNDGWYAGISSTHLPASELELLNFQTARHYYTMGGYKYRDAFDVGGLTLDMQALTRTDLVKLSFDLNARAIINDQFWGGLTYRLDDGIGLMAGVEYNNFILGYSYDISTHSMATLSRGSHEILFKYCHFLPPPPVTKSRNPRYL